MTAHSLSDWFENLLFNSGRRSFTVTVIGSGGKTSLIRRLAVSLAPGRKILITPTTKMFPFSPGEVPPSVNVKGIFNEASGKLESLPLCELEKIIPSYDLVFIEGDGSKGLPLKAWAEHEPVVPPFTDITIGILPLWPLGKPVSESIVHRLRHFIALTGAEEGKPVKQEHILRLITGRTPDGSPGSGRAPGLFAKAAGRKLLFFNQIEDYESLRQAREITASLPAEFRSGELDRIIAGSVKENRITELCIGC